MIEMVLHLLMIPRFHWLQDVSVIFHECSDDVHISSMIVLRVYSFCDRCKRYLLSGSRSGTQGKAECQTILKGVSSMETLWEGNGMSEKDQKEILCNSDWMRQKSKITASLPLCCELGSINCLMWAFLIAN